MEGEDGFHFNTESHFEGFVLHFGRGLLCMALRFQRQVFDVYGILVCMRPQIYEQALIVDGSVLLSASGGKCGNVLTAWNWLYSGIVVVFVRQTSMPECNMPFAELCVCMVVVCRTGCLCMGISEEYMCLKMPAVRVFMCP